MADVVVVEALRSPIGRRNGGLSRTPPTELLGDVLLELFRRTGLDPGSVDHVIAGCVSQVGNQASNVARNSWLGAGLPLIVPAVTVNTQCGSSQEAVTLAHAMLAGGLAHTVVACGVESMSTIPLGAAIPGEPDYGQPRGGRYAEVYEPTTQFEGAERIAEKWGLSRRELDAFGLRSQELAAQAWSEDRFASQIVPIVTTGIDEAGRSDECTISRDEGLRTTSLEALAGLRPNLPGREPGFHTAGTSSQISDGAAAVLLMTEDRARQVGLRPMARLRSSVLVGSDPVLMLTGPIPATEAVLKRSGLAIDDIDLFEVNEAFASVVVAWQKATGANPERVNPNGGAIALGHPLGATGCVLLTKAVHSLVREDKRFALVTMCCGGGLGTGTVLERIG